MNPHQPAVILGLAAVFTACSPGGASTAGPSPPASTARPGLLSSQPPAPSGLAVTGQLTVAADPTEAPLVYYDRSNQFAGFTIDLVAKIATQIGLKLNVINIDGVHIVLGLTDQQHRYDMGVAPQAAPQQLSASANTLEYLVNGQVILARHDDRQISGPASLCGLTVGANRDRTGQAIVVRDNGGTCQGKPIVYAPYDSDVRGIHDLEAGTLQAYIQDYAVATAFARLYSDIRIVPGRFSAASEVFVFAPTDSTVHDAVSKAFDHLRHDGDYRKLLERWGLQEGAVR